MTRPLPRWYRHRCDHERVEIATAAGVVRDYCRLCGMRWVWRAAP